MPVYEVELADKTYEVELPDAPTKPVSPATDSLAPMDAVRAAGALGAQPFVSATQGALQRDPIDPLGIKEALVNVPNPELTYGATGAALGASVPIPFASLGLNATGSAFGKAIELGKGKAELPGDTAKQLAHVALRNAGIQAGTMGLGKAWQFLKGNTKQIEATSKALDRAAHNTVLSLRRGGKLHDKVLATLTQESDKAWAPMKQVAGSIPQPITIEELKATIAQRLMNDPGRLQAATMILDDIATTSPSLTAADLADLSTNIGQSMRKAALRGDVAKSFSDLVYSDLRSGIADILEAKAPLQLKGAVGLAKSQWANYATDRDALFRYFKPGASANQSTTTGINALKRVALGEAGPYEQDFFQRVQQATDIDLPSSIRPFAVATQRAKQLGAVGKETARLVKYLGVPTATLAYLLGRKQ